MPAPLLKLTISLIKRNAVKRGPTSSDAWNDTFEEISSDLTRLADQWNNSLFPLVQSLPASTFTNGLDGRGIYVDSTSTGGISDASYFNTVAVRPNSIKEQFDAIYTKFVTQKAELESEITSSINISTLVPVTRSITGVSGISGGGDLSLDRTLSLNQAFTPTWTGTHIFQGAVTTAARVHASSIKTAAGNFSFSATEEKMIIKKASGAATQVTLPSGPVAGREVAVIDGKGDAAANNITVIAAAGNINGAANDIINTNYGFQRYLYNGTEWNKT